MESFKVGQGAILTAGTTLITIGAVQLSNKDIFGLLVVSVGAVLVFWREYRKN